MFFRQPTSEAISSDTFLVMGLGNIGTQYVNTRHNIGFEVVDEIARRYNVRFRKGRFKGEEATLHIAGHRVLLVKPHTFMNLSGDAVMAASRFYKILPSHILVICDDVNLPAGKIRLRARGSDGGHNGLWHIINRLGTQDFARLRINLRGQRHPHPRHGPRLRHLPSLDPLGLVRVAALARGPPGLGGLGL